MTQEEMLSKLKKDVRSLLMSAKMGLSPDQLKRDYINMLGHPMPLKPLGFRNVLDMAKDMPDVISFSYLADGSLVLKVVSDKETEGIKLLVANQRVSKNIKSRRGGFGSFPRYHTHHIRPVVLPRWGRTPPVLPAQLKAQVRQLLSQGPLRLAELECRFLQCFGHPLRVGNYGFYSIGEMISAAGDFVQVLHGRMGSVLSLKEAVVIRKGPIKPQRNIPTCPSSSSSSSSTSSISQVRTKVQPGFDSTAGSMKQIPASSPVSQSAPSPICNTKDALSCDSVLDVSCCRQTEQLDTDPSNNVQNFQKCVLKLEAELRQKILENGDAGTVSPDLKAKLLQVVEQRCEGLSIHELPTEYKRLFGEDLPVLQCGFLSVTELVGALSDTLHLKAVENDEGPQWIVQTACSSQPGEGENEGEVGTSYYLNSTQSGWEDEYDDGSPGDISLNQLSLKSLQQMPEMCPAVMLPPGLLVPPDALQGQRLRPPGRHEPLQLLAVLVEHVESPSNFYIRFSENAEAKAVEDMMMEMRSCYSCPQVSERYRLPARYVRPGQTCCVAPRSLWFYRVVIHRVLSPTHVEVYYVDFGDLSVVETASLKFLKSCYSELPAQAVPAALAGIKPSGAGWTSEATASFRKLCFERTLVALLHVYHGDMLQLFLCDTHTENDLYIHCVLQSQGHGHACAPGASAAVNSARKHTRIYVQQLYMQFNPVTLYLREGLSDLEDVEEDKAATPISQPPVKAPPWQQTASSSTTNVEVPLLEIPALELVEVNVVGPQAQDLDPRSARYGVVLGQVVQNPSESPVAPPPSAAASHTTDPCGSRENSNAPVQPSATIDTYNNSGTASQTASAGDESYHGNARQGVASGCSPVIMNSPPPSVMSLSLYTPDIAKIHGSSYGLPGSLLHHPSPGRLFPVFGSREMTASRLWNRWATDLLPKGGDLLNDCPETTT